MSNRRRIKAARIEALDAAMGRRIPGGCDDCHAYQTVNRDQDGIYHLHIHHDDWCPFFNGVTR